MQYANYTHTVWRRDARVIYICNCPVSPTAVSNSTTCDEFGTRDVRGVGSSGTRDTYEWYWYIFCEIVWGLAPNVLCLTAIARIWVGDQDPKCP